MIDASELADNLRDKLRALPALVAMLDGDPENIFCYHDRYPDSASTERAILTMPSPGLMILWQGRSLGSFGSTEVFKHHLSVFFRAGTVPDGGPPTSYYQMDQLLWRGIPDGESLTMRYLTVHRDCYPMDPYGITRQRDAEGVDYFEAPLTFTEKGDS